MGAKVLIVGGGGREHALAWKISQSPKVDKVYVAPGNAGTALVAENVPIGFTDVEGLVTFAKENAIDLTVIGQEAASEARVANAFQVPGFKSYRSTYDVSVKMDTTAHINKITKPKLNPQIANYFPEAILVTSAFNEAGLTIFGPTETATLIESSKTFSKNLMEKQSIPTSKYKNFTDPVEAIDYANTRPLPVVVKADGLAAGKGVIICESYDQAKKAINEIMVQKVFGNSGSKVVIEDFLQGQEVSTHALSDGKNFVLFPSSQDHKQIYDGDKGPNTGGMGVIAPVPWVTDSHMETVKNKIVAPALRGLSDQGTPFVGCLYPGLMIDKEDINVVEFNARFGDPEAEVYMRLLDSDLYEIMIDCATGKLDPSKIAWKNGFAACVILASGGYPGNYKKGIPISGLDIAEKLDDVVVFHAGTTSDNKGFKTAGGRVLAITSIGDTLDLALEKAYKAVDTIKFEGKQFRSDIGRRQASI